MALHLDVQRKLVLIILAVAAIICAWVLESTKSAQKPVPGYETKRQAAELAMSAYETLGRAYAGKFGPLTPEQIARDPARTGLLGTDRDGSSYTPLTNAGGSATAKQRAINPNFAPVIVDYFRELGLSAGDPVAVALTGSYPGLNVSLFAAMKAMDLRPVVITSVCGSRFGANLPEFTWLDMERVLADAGVMNIRSVAASPGGEHDRGENLTPEGLQLVWEAAERNGAASIKASGLDDSIRRRMEIYEREAGGQRYKAYVNVGGSTASLGIPLTRARDLHGLRTGLDREIWRRSTGWGPHKGTMVLMGEQGIPVIHLGETEALATRYGFPMSHRDLRRVPAVGNGTALMAEAHSPGVALILLVAYVLLTVVLVLPEIRGRILGRPAHEPAAAPGATRT